MVVGCFNPKNVHNVSNNLLINCGQMSVSRKAEISYDIAQWSKMIEATCGALDFDDRIPRVSFEYRSVIMKRNWFPVVSFDSRPKMCIATGSGVMLAKNSFRRLFLLKPARFIEHSRQLLSVTKLSLATCGQ